MQLWHLYPSEFDLYLEVVNAPKIYALKIPYRQATGNGIFAKLLTQKKMFLNIFPCV